MKNLIVNTGLVAGSLLVALVVIDLVARIFVNIPAMYSVPPGITVGEARGFWSLDPDFKGDMGNNVDFNNKAIEMDAYGSRVVPCGTENTGENGLVFLIGDSQTFGWGLSNAETWANQAQCRLNAVLETPPKVLNFGVPGTQVDQYVNRGLNQILPAVANGDVVVISLAWNDLVTFYKGDKWVSGQLAAAGLREISGAAGMPAVEPVPPGASASAGAASSASPSRQALIFRHASPKRILYPPTWRYEFYKKYGILVPNFSSLADIEASLTHMTALFRHIWSSARLLFYRIRPADSFFSKVDPDAYRLNFLTLKALAQRLEDRGAKVLIQFLPHRVFFDSYYYGSYSKNGVVFPARDYFWHVGKPFCDSLQLTCINRFENLLTDVRDAHTFSYDGHYNETGARRVGEALARDILKALERQKNKP